MCQNVIFMHTDYDKLQSYHWTCFRCILQITRTPSARKY